MHTSAVDEMAKSRSIVDKLTVLELVKFAILNDGDSGVSNSKLTGFVSKVSVQNRVSILTFKFAREFQKMIILVFRVLSSRQSSCI